MGEKLLKATKFIITKANKPRMSVEDAYSGPSCEDAGIPYGKLYYSLQEAEQDLAKLRKFNTVTNFKIATI
jgi:hypothetical protein